MIETHAASGKKILSFAYVHPVDAQDAASELKWLKSSATDAQGGRVAFVHSVLPNGNSVISRIQTPSGDLNYAYDTSGNLSVVTYPNGDRSTLAREIENGLLKIRFSEAGAGGAHRNKTAYYSGNIAAYLLETTTDRPQVFNQSSQLVRKILNGAGELAYWGAPGGNGSGSTMHRKVYEGGGRMRFFDVAENSAFSTWSIPNGLSASDPFGSIVASREKNGHLSPYWQYAENRSRQPSQVTTPESPVHYYLYDGAGNMRLERVGDRVRRQAFDARFAKPTLSVDFSGKARLMAYDDTGNLVSRKSGWVFDKSLGAGVSVPGLKCSYYENVNSLDALDSATPVSVQQTDTVALGQRETPEAHWGMRFEGKLVLENDGERTFQLSADDGARLYIDGVKVTEVAYYQGEVSAQVNLTAGTHDIRVDFLEFGGESRLNLSWSGPETTDASGVVAKTLIGPNFLAHETTADELTLRPSAVASEETWEYYPAGDALAGLQKAHVDAAGKRTEYAYDAKRRLVQIRETGDGGDLVVVQTRTYDETGNLASTADALGRTVAYTYDSRNRLVKTAYADGTTETVAYGTGADVNLVVARKNRAGSVTKTEYDAAGRALRVVAGYALADNEGAVTRILEHPSVTTYAYLIGTGDAVRILRDGKKTERDYDYKGRVITERTFPSQNRVLTTASAYDADEVLFSRTDIHGCRTFYAYRRPDMALVREVREIKPGALGALADEAAVLALARDSGANPGYSVTDYDKDGDGRTLLRTDPLGVKTRTVYDAASRVASVTRAVGLPAEVTTSSTHDGAGRPLTQTDGLNRVMRREYTHAGRLKTVVQPDNTREEYTYFPDGKLATRKDADGFIAKYYWSPCCGRDAGNADPLGRGQMRFTDGEGRVTYVATVKNVEAARAFGPNLPADAVVAAQTMKYDARGRLAASTKWLVAPASVDPKNPPVATDATQGLTTTYAYFDDISDARFAPVLAKLTEQGVTLTAGSATVVTNPAGEQSFTVADGAGRTVFSGVFNK